MWNWIISGAGGLLFVAVALWLLMLVSLRTKFAPMLSVVRRLNRAFWNPRAMRTAGRAGAYAAVIRHVGRRTGTEYATPIGVLAIDDGFLTTLLYGTGADWLKNVLAAGIATIEHEGDIFTVGDPQVLTAAEAGSHFAPGERRTQRIYGVDEFLYMRRQSSAAAPAGDSRRG